VSVVRESLLELLFVSCKMGTHEATYRQWISTTNYYPTLENKEHSRKGFSYPTVCSWNTKPSTDGALVSHVGRSNTSPLGLNITSGTSNALITTVYQQCYSNVNDFGD